MFGLIKKYNEYRRYRNTVRELSYMSDKELGDIGISRFDIKSIARQSFK